MPPPINAQAEINVSFTISLATSVRVFLPIATAYDPLITFIVSTTTAPTTEGSIFSIEAPSNPLLQVYVIDAAIDPLIKPSAVPLTAAKPIFLNCSSSISPFFNRYSIVL